MYAFRGLQLKGLDYINCNYMEKNHTPWFAWHCLHKHMQTWFSWHCLSKRFEKESIFSSHLKAQFSFSTDISHWLVGLINPSKLSLQDLYVSLLQADLISTHLPLCSWEWHLLSMSLSVSSACNSKASLSISVKVYKVPFSLYRGAPKCVLPKKRWPPTA